MVSWALTLTYATGLLAGCGNTELNSTDQSSPTATPTLVGPTSSSPAATSIQKPELPLSLVPPPAPSSLFEGTDLTELPAAQLAGLGRQFYDQKQYAKAIQFLHFAIERGSRGAYDLACDYALDQNVDAGFYWLQKAAMTDGVEADWAQNDPDLAILRNDSRWSKIASFLSAYNTYWAASDHHTSVLVVPDNYAPGTPIGVLVGMHGRGADPDGFVSKEAHQDLANQLNMAIVGISGSVPRGERSFVWSEEPARDAAHIRRVLSELKEKLTIAPGRLIAYGFSQGGQMAFEVAFANPSEYLGAIAMSPGTTKEATLRELTPAAANKKQAFVCTCGAREHIGNVLLTRTDWNFAKNAGCRTELKLYEGVETHGFPTDFHEAFPRWVRFVEGEVASQ